MIFVKQKILEAGYKMTNPRLLVAEYLSKLHSPISAKNLHQKIKNVDRASIYRVLKLFEELDVVDVLTVNKEKLYCLAEKPHHHIICRSCGYTESIKCEHSFNKIKQFSKVSHQLTITGLCNKCNK